MSHWISSREFAETHNLEYEGLMKSVKRADKKGKKICHFKGNILPFLYKQGKGRGGKVLQIWNIPLSEKQVEALEKGYPVKYVLEEMGEAVECAKVDKVMDCHSPKVLRNDEVGSPRNDTATQPNVMESRDFKTLDCKGIDNEKTSQNIQGKTLYARGCNNANECASRTTSSSDSTLYRNDLSACEITQSEVCVQEPKSKVSFVGLNAKQIYRQLKKKSPIIASYVFLFRKFKILKASAYH